VTVREELRTELERMVRYRDVKADPPTIEVHDVRAADPPLDLIAIDGSYTFLLNLGSMWLAVARAAAIPFALTESGFHPRPPTVVDRAILVSTWQDIVLQQDAFHQQLFEATRGSADHHKEMVNEFRKHLEGELALKIARESKGVVVALDGSLAAVPRELDHLEDVVAACEKNGNVLVGVSKDSFLHAFGRSMPDEQFLQSYGGTGYVRVPKEFEGRQRGLLYGDVYFARLHAQAPKWFRVDVGTFKDDPDFAFSHLAAHARSGLSLGYPYPLMEAHRLAVLIRQVREPYEEEILKACAHLGLRVGEVVAGLTQIEGRRRGAFHEYLDNFARDVK
jgi:hypothetical protein